MSFLKNLLHVLLGLKCTPQEEAHVSILSKSEVRDMAATFGSLSTSMNKEVSSANNLMLFTKLSAISLM